MKFTNCTFEKSLLLTSCTFLTPISFEGSKFKKRIEAGGADFIYDVSFEWCKFEEGCNFSNSMFYGDAKFSKATFLGRSDFNGISHGHTFDGHYGTIDFSDIQNKSMVRLQVDGFKPNLDFSQATNFPGSRIEIRSTDLRKTKLLPSSLSQFELTDCQFSEIGDKAALFDHKQGYENHGILENAYRELKNQFESRKNPRLAGEFHFHEKSFSLSNEKRHADKFLLLTYKYLSGFGEKLWIPLAFFLVITIFVSLGLINNDDFCIATWKKGADTGIIKFLKTILFSIQNSLFMRPERCTEKITNGTIEFLLTINRILGPLFIALFSFSLRQRLKR